MLMTAYLHSVAPMIDLARAGSIRMAAAWPAPLYEALGPVLAELLMRADIALSVKELAGGTYVHVNAPMAALLGRDIHEVFGRTDAQLLDPAPWAALRNAELAALARNAPTGSELKLDLAGAAREFLVWRATFAIGGDAPTHLLSLWFEQTQAKRREAQLHLALTQLEQQQRANDQLRRDMSDGALRDAVTGLASRAHFDDQLRREVDLSMREHREFALAEIAIDPATESVLAGGDAAKLRVVEALGPAVARQHPRDGCVVPPERRPFRAIAVGCRARYRAFTHGATAAPVRDTDRRTRRARTRLHGVDGRSEFSAHREHARSVAASLRRRARGGAATRRQRRRAGEHPVRAVNPLVAVS